MVFNTEVFRLIYNILIILSIPIYIYTGFVLLFRYREKRNNQTLAASLFFIIGAMAIISLVLEQIIMEINFASEDFPLNQPLAVLKGNPTADISRILVTLAIFLSSLSALALCYFALVFLKLEERKNQIIMIITSFTVVLYSWLYFSLPYEWVKRTDIWEYYHKPNDQLLLFILFAIPVWLVPTILGFTYYKARNFEPYIKNRLMLFEIGFVILSIAYTFQLISPNIFTGLGIFYFPLHFYVVYTAPEWLKKRLGN